MYVEENLNPNNSRVGDCVIRAISKVLGQSWEHTYMDLAILGMQMKDLPSANVVWGAYLHDKGFHRRSIPDTCPDCYTIEDFCRDYPFGTYLAATGSHVAAIIDGLYFDTWRSGSEVVIFYFYRESEV